MNLVRGRIALAILVLMSIALAGCGSSGATSPAGKTAAVRIGWVGLPHFTAMHVLEKQVDDPTLKLDMQRFQLSQDEVNALSSGDLDMAAVGYVHFLKLIEAGVDVTAISGVGGKGSRLLVRKGVEVSQWTDLKKLRVGIARGSTQDLQLRSALEAHSIDPQQINYVVFTNAADMLIGLQQGAVDVVSTWEPQASQAILTGVATEFEPLYPDSWSSNALLVVRTDYLKNNPKTVDSVLKQLSTAVTKVSGDPSYWLAQASEFSPTSKEVLEKAIANSDQSVNLDLGDLSKIAKVMTESGYLKNQLSATTIQAHVDLQPLATVTGMSMTQLQSRK